VKVVHSNSHPVQLHHPIGLRLEDRAQAAVIHRQILAVCKQTDHRAHGTHGAVGQASTLLLEKSLEFGLTLRVRLDGSLEALAGS